MIRKEQLSPSWQKVQLRSAVEFLDYLRRPVTKIDRTDGEYPYYGANGQQGTIDDFIFDEPLILLAEDGGNFGQEGRTVAYKVEGKCWVNNHAHVLRPKPNVDINFLLRHLEYYDVTPYITGTTRGKLTKDAASRIELVLPPLPEQKRIAAMLDKADSVRRKRQEAVRLTEELLRSVFLDMFGDPVTNPKGWKTDRLEKHISFLTTGSRGWAEHYCSEGSRFIRSLDVQMNYISNIDAAYVNPPIGAEAERTRVQFGDVLLTVTGSKIGRVAPIPKKIGDAYVSQHVAIIRPVNTMNPRYLSMYLSSASGGQRQIQHSQYGQTKPGLNLEQIRKFIIPCPPVTLQQRFVDISEKLYDAGLQIKNSEIASNDLFSSLLNRSFMGAR